MNATQTPAAVDLSVSLGRVTLQNPVMTASGTCGYGGEYSPYMDLNRLGAFTTKSVTMQERPGNPPPRIVETACGMLNAIGLANVGLERFIAEKVPELRTFRIPVFVNVAGHSREEYVAVCRRLDEVPEIAGLELNVSCPNVADGLTFGTDANRLYDLVGAVRREVQRCLLIVKLSPNVTDIIATARAAVDAGAEALSLVNTFVGMAIDIEQWRPVLANTTGGLSGPAIKPLALHLVHRVYREVAAPAKIPLIGMGGIETWQDAIEFMLAGATAISVGTSLFIDPTCPIRIIEALPAYLRRRSLRSARELVGRLNTTAEASRESGAEG
ncbi:MAG: dihydroorotate dehydrogenase [Phycisphaerae bacterium]